MPRGFPVGAESVQPFTRPGYRGEDRGASIEARARWSSIAADAQRTTRLGERRAQGWSRRIGSERRAAAAGSGRVWPGRERSRSARLLPELPGGTMPTTWSGSSSPGEGVLPSPPHRRRTVWSPCSPTSRPPRWRMASSERRLMEVGGYEPAKTGTVTSSGSRKPWCLVTRSRSGSPKSRVRRVATRRLAWPEPAAECPTGIEVLLNGVVVATTGTPQPNGAALAVVTWSRGAKTELPPGEYVHLDVGAALQQAPRRGRHGRDPHARGLSPWRTGPPRTSRPTRRPCACDS